MKIVLVTFGSRGDVQPMLALCLALKSEGHNVLLAGPPEKADWANIWAVHSIRLVEILPPSLTV